uniref:Uncharacterized protein n=1 Tax=Anguilla anguilla TaxID=7936 RepID=A0A0E9TNT5_ANGAN
MLQYLKYIFSFQCMYFNFSYNVVYVVSERDNCPIFFRHVKFSIL